MALPRIENTPARRIFLDRHALLEHPVGPSRGADLLALIRRLGFVQVDSVRTVERAQHMILHARRGSYRPAHLTPLLERDRTLFEHWTHDAAVIPTEFLPYWHLRHDRDRRRLVRDWAALRQPGYEARFAPVLAHIARHGACRAEDLREAGGRKAQGWWDWHPSKTALEFHWRTGALAVCRRDGFRKVYDLAERVLPAHDHIPTEAETLDWACDTALDRLGFASPGEIAAFWALAKPAEVREWAARGLARGTVQEVEIVGADGATRRQLARPGTAEAAERLPGAPPRVRILSPFDPALRDRARALRLFGFDYRIEIFVPEAKRRYGYYVFPVLEGQNLIGRIDMTCRRAETDLRVTAYWPEPGFALGAGRTARLEAALARTARLAGSGSVAFEDGWYRG